LTPDPSFWTYFS